MNASDPRHTFDRVQELIPWGTQTNGKRPDAAMGEDTPYFIERAEGCRMLDTDGRWFIDYRSALGPIILGYAHPGVQAAVRKQLEKGVVFSLASPLEFEVAQRLVQLIPGLEQVRFLKSGNETNLAAIRLARAFTGRERIITCGYHGHGDWFSCGSGYQQPWSWPRDGNGVPRCLDDLVVRIPYGDVEALESTFAAVGEQVAGLIMVPHDWSGVDGGDFVRRARACTHQYGTVLIFDQVLTGFRLGNLGAQGYFGVIPDLSTYGKALANGYPLAAFGGKKEIMAMLDRVMITTTHAGETLSLAAAKATLEILTKEPVIDHIVNMGERLMAGFDALARGAGLSARSVGLPQAPGFLFGVERDPSLRHAFDRGLLRRGIFPASQFLLTYAHEEAVIDETLEAMGRSYQGCVLTFHRIYFVLWNWATIQYPNALSLVFAVQGDFNRTPIYHFDPTTGRSSSCLDG